MDKAKIIAFYLPQFHPFKENDEWWGAGFSEWTNLAKARKLFPGHEQPKLPGELGFYDLRLPETRKAQADLARQYGIDGFCYYYYRLNPNLHLMERPLREVLESKQPDFPFMICWANHDWQQKLFNTEKGNTSRLLAEQEYGDAKDIEQYFYEILPYFKDDRYIKDDNCPLFSIYEALKIPNLEEFIRIWNDLAKHNGFSGVKFIGYTEDPKNHKEQMLKAGCWAVNSCKLYAFMRYHSQIKRYFVAALRKIFKLPYICSYIKAQKDFIGDDEKDENVMPTVIPNWDRSPRRGRYSEILIKSTPEGFSEHLRNVFSIIKSKNNKYIFIKSWNEWGEGNYLEPDRKFGRKYLETLKSEREEFGV